MNDIIVPMSKKKSFLFSSLAIGITLFIHIIVNLISIPIGLNYFGSVLYGAWLIVVTILAYTQIVETGISGALTVKIAETNVRHQHIEIFTVGLKLLSLIALSLTIVWSLVYYFFPEFGAYLVGDVPEIYKREISLALFYAILYTLWRLPIFAIYGYFNGTQRMYIAKAYEVARSLCLLIALLITVSIGGTIADLALMNGMLMILILLISIVHIIVELKLEFLKCFIKSHILASIYLKQIIALGSRFLLLGIAALIIVNSDYIIISHFAGIDKVVNYSIPQQFFLLSMMLVNIPLVALWPILSKAFANKEWRWLKNAYNSMFYIQIVSATIICLVAIISLNDIISLWIGNNSINISLGLILAFSSTTIMSSFVGVNSTLINAMGPKNIVAFWGVTQAALKLVIAITLVQYLGLIGIALGTFIAAVSIDSWFMPSYIKRNSCSMIQVNVKAILKMLSSTVVSVFIVSAISINITNIFGRYALLLMVILIYLLTVWYVQSNEFRRELIITVKKAIINFKMRRT